tara:strand:+ start:2035 stop:2307 length:273 start_codon:yes stop_codon:yes gene_type:complete
MDEIKNKVENIENLLTNINNKDDIIELYKSLIIELKLLFEKAFIDFLIMKKRDEKRVSYSQKYYNENKEKIKKTAKEHYNKYKKSYKEGN